MREEALEMLKNLQPLLRKYTEKLKAEGEKLRAEHPELDACQYYRGADGIERVKFGTVGELRNIYQALDMMVSELEGVVEVLCGD